MRKARGFSPTELDFFQEMCGLAAFGLREAAYSASSSHVGQTVSDGQNFHPGKTVSQGLAKKHGVTTYAATPYGTQTSGAQMEPVTANWVRASLARSRRETALNNGRLASAASAGRLRLEYRPKLKPIHALRAPGSDGTKQDRPGNTSSPKKSKIRWGNRFSFSH
jgi:hypothetical protein